jgi:hypothetical protein
MSDRIKELQEAVQLQKDKKLESVPVKVDEPEPISDIDVYKNEETDEVILYESNMPSIDKIQVFLLEQIKDVGKSLPEKMRESATDNAYETALWEYIKNIPVPDALIKKREGSDGKMYDYFPEFFTTGELDRIFPGWWMQDVTTRYDDKSMAYITSGNLCIEYVLPSGIKKIRTVYAVGGADVFAKKGTSIPSQPGDRAAASVTKFIKLAGKRLGLGLELYHDQILPARRTQFERLVSGWGEYATEVRTIYNASHKGSGVRKLCRILPTPEQTERLKFLVTRVPEKVADAIWKNFVKLHRDKADAWLTDWEGKITKKEQEKAEEERKVKEELKKTEFQYE